MLFNETFYSFWKFCKNLYNIYSLVVIFILSSLLPMYLFNKDAVGTHASLQDDIEMVYMNENQSGDMSRGHEVPISELEVYVKSGFDHEEYFFDQFHVKFFFSLLLINSDNFYYD